jgi:O-6-methylguanine DNA methyltransferase
LKINSASLSTPVGDLLIQATAEEIVSIVFIDQEKEDLFSPLILKDAIQEDDFVQLRKAPLLIEASKQIKEYFQGTRCYFKLPLRTFGTPIEQKVTRFVSIVPYGHVVSYLDVARMVHIENGARFIGNCMRKNPLPILIPCHRVITSTGKMGGFSAGAERKKFLLQWEKTNWEMNHESSSSGRWLWYTFKRRNGEQTETTD